MSNLMHIEQMVRGILEDYPDARNSDHTLYAIVVGKMNPDVLHKPLQEYLMYFKDYKLPRYESVARCRRKLQEEEPHLRGVEDVRKWRKENETEFKEYAKEIR